ncbi:MAG: 50S ribosomal protein L29 [Candidatus Marinimicrobia bacterium]|nr:50S ribosomal protein L29 [Candidatus Neomarinimicrobiota bacterium]
MKKNEFSELSLAELNEKLRENLESLQNYRFQLSMQQLENISVIPKVKKEIAQIKTLLNEYKNGIRKIEGLS